MEGARAALLGAALLAAGVVFGSEPLLLPGIALLALPILLAGWVRVSARGARVGRDALPGRVTEGEALTVSHSVRAGALPLIATIEDEALPNPLAVRGWRPLHDFAVAGEGRALPRGRHTIGPPALRIGDPLGITSRIIAGGAAAEVLALPRVEPVLAPGGAGDGSLGTLLDGLGEQARPAGRESPAEPDLDGLRPYRPGTPASRIHWPALARHDQLLERRFAHPGAGGALVALDPAGAIDRETLDRAVRAAASLCFHLGRRGGCELQLPGRGGRFAIGSAMAGWREAQTALALVDEGDGGLDPHRLAGAGALFLVRAAGGAGAPARIATGYLLTPDRPSRGAIAFTVAGMSAVALSGAPRAMAAAG